MGEQKRARLKKQAEREMAGKDDKKKKGRPIVRYGLNQVTCLIERKKAKLVIIAHDVVPIELVIWMPALCKKMGVPYCIVKEDVNTLDQLIGNYVAMFNDSYSSQMKKWGGGVLGFKATAALKLKEKEKQAELKKMGHLLS